MILRAPGWLIRRDSCDFAAWFITQRAIFFKKETKRNNRTLGFFFFFPFTVGCENRPTDAVVVLPAAAADLAASSGEACCCSALVLNSPVCWLRRRRVQGPFCDFYLNYFPHTHTHKRSFPARFWTFSSQQNPDVICISAGLRCFERCCNLLRTLLHSCLFGKCWIYLNTFFFAPALSIGYLKNSKQDMPPRPTTPALFFFFVHLQMCDTLCTVL